MMMFANAVLFLMWIGHVSSNWVPAMENPGLYEGDIVLTPDQLNEVKQGKFSYASTNNQQKLWPNAVVPYTIDSRLRTQPDAMREIQISFNQYHKYTCIRFKKRTNEVNYIRFVMGGGCSSPVGRVSHRPNSVSLGKGCWWRATVMHEIGHSLGLHHEQSRPDRDRFVTILFHNINKGTEFNFRHKGAIDSQTPYDYRSMMHYTWNAFGENQRMTIRTLDPAMQYEIGQGEGFSRIDILQLQKMYNCKGTYPTLPPYVPPPKGCFDLGGSCAKGVWEGNCNKPQWKAFMSAKCRKSCGLCGSGPRPTNGPGPTKKSSTSGGGSSCSDRVNDCAKLGRYRCNDSRKFWRDYMRRSCKNYCQIC